MKHLLISLLVSIGATAAALLFSATPANAASASVSCGATTCSVDSSQRGESDWKSSATKDSSGNVETSTGGKSNFSYTYTDCSYWIPTRGGQTTSKFPAKDSGTFTCGFLDGGVWSGGTGAVWFQCPPRSDRASNGRVNVYYTDPATHEKSYAYFFCLYPTESPAARIVGEGKVYTGGQGDFFLTNTDKNAAGAYGSSGLKASSSGYIDRGVNLNNPRAYMGSWQPAFTALTATNAAGDPLYGYYRLQWTLDYRICQEWAYPAWTGEAGWIDCAQRGTDRSANPYTYACNLNPALQPGINNGAVFIPHLCNSNWQCVIGGDTQVGGKTTPLSIIRNGEPNPVTFPTVGVSGSGVQNPSNWKFKNTALTGSTPSTSYTTASWKWADWDDYRQTGTIAFHWASESAAKPFVWQTKFRFTGQFFVPTQASVGGQTQYKWVTSTTECPQLKNSPSISVVRATGG